MLLPGELEALEEQVFGVLVQLHVQVVELLDAPAHGLAQGYISGTRAVDLSEGGDEAQAERPLKQVLGLALELGQAIEGHVLEVAHGAAEQDVSTLALIHGGQIVAAHQAEVGQHAHLPVVGQIGGAVHEVAEGDSGPVVSVVAVGQLVLCGRAAITHVQGGFPGGSSLNVLPLAQVAGDGVT
ncbi:hypothetical protein NQD34_015462, partial [Periophthalmus magnuspinnatus]